MEALDGQALAGGLAVAAAALQAILEERSRRKVFREGASVVICGRPNAGKSSIFNAILGKSRALVSPQAGTTRDWLEETLVLDGVAVRLVDTAGLGQGGGELERLGQDTARELMAQADLALVVLDGSQTLTVEDEQVLWETVTGPRLLAVNKADLGAVWELAGLDEFGVKREEVMRVSAKDGAGLERLMEALGKGLSGGEPEPAAGEVVASARQAQALERVLKAVDQAREALLAPELAAELAAADLTTALAALGEVDGQGAPEEVIETVFRDFCPGK